MSDKGSRSDYWKANLAIVRNLMIIWAVAWLVCSILLFPVFKGIEFGGATLGFWFAQQGSILIFLVLIFYYAYRMNKLDREFGVDEE